jgi:putative hydrolase of the HAD superfamily
MCSNMPNGASLNSVILWDFDGTLARRPGGWTGAMIQVLDEMEPDHRVKAQDVREHLRRGFPWHTPDVPHPELCSPATWWSRLEKLLASVYVSLGYSSDQAATLAQKTHELYVAPESFVLYDDTIPGLERLARCGWRHIILSNHVPELPSIVEGLGIAKLVERSLSSATIGYEKPHAMAYKAAMRAAGSPERIWMVGDSIASDVVGAEAMGIPAILVRTAPTEAVARSASDIVSAAEMIIGSAS